MARPPEFLFGLPPKEIAQTCGVDLATARRWKRGTTRPPQSALMLLSRDLGMLHPRWAGWHISARGELCSPENWIATPGDVLSIQLTQAQLAAYRHETLQLRATLAGMEFEEQPRPEQWSIALEG